MDEPLGVNPTQGVVADAELAGVVGDDDRAAEQTLGLDCAPQRRFAGDAHRIGRHLQVGQAEGTQVVHPILARAKDARSVAAEPVDDVLRQIARAHVGDRGGINHVGRRPAEQAAEESQARLAGPGAERGEAVGADVGGEAGLAGVAGAGVVDGDEGRAHEPRPQHRFVLGAEALQLGAQEPHHLPLGNRQAHADQKRHDPFGAPRSSQVIWP